MKKEILYKLMDGSRLKIGIVVSRWNENITLSLLESCIEALKKCNVQEKNITVLNVPGSYELAFSARQLIKSKKNLDAIVTLGCVIKGETMHFEYICDAVAHGIMELNVDEDIPVIFGVLTCLNEKQAKVRSRGKNNHGYGWGMAAVEMGLLRRKKI